MGMLFPYPVGQRMKLTRLIAIATILGSISLSGLVAQTVSPGDQPAEFPPSSFKGKQYVDSNGCVFIRAGIDGDVAWIPRVTRKREGVCGFKPTFAGQVVPSEPADQVQAELIALDDAASAPISAPAVRPVPAPVRRPDAPPVRVVRQTAPAPNVVVRTVADAPVRQPRIIRADAVCPSASELSQQYYSNTKYPVRCGPQTQPIIANGTMQPSVALPTRRSIRAEGPIQVNPQRWIAPLHVAINNLNTTNVTVPPGYRKVWNDDRLNPYRAYQTLEGHRAMQMMWTSTVPRRLINQANGEDVTAKVALVYPFTDYQHQRTGLGEVSVQRRSGKVVPQVIGMPEAQRAVYSSRSGGKVTHGRRGPYSGR